MLTKLVKENKLVTSNKYSHYVTLKDGTVVFARNIKEVIAINSDEIQNSDRKHSE